MAKCLITKLQGTVDNPDLLKLGEMRFTIYNRNGDNVAVDTGVLGKSGTNLLINVVSGGPFTDGTIQQVANGYNSISSKAVLSISNKYDIQDFGFIINGFRQFVGTIDDLAYTSGMQNVRVYNDSGLAVGSLSSMKASASTLVNLLLRSTGIVYDTLPSLPALDDLSLVLNVDVPFADVVAKCPNITKLGGKHSGNVSQLGKLIKLQQLNLAYGAGSMGSLDDMAQAMISAGRVSASYPTLSFIGNGVVTYRVDGVETVIPTSATKTITFSENTYVIS